jgi:hypothetical protein
MMMMILANGSGGGGAVAIDYTKNATLERIKE